FNINYQENYIFGDGSTGGLKGNSFTALAVHPSITYRARQDLSLPFFIALDASLPAVVLTGQEAGHKTMGGVTGTTQKEDVRHTDLTFRALLGVELLPWLEPYVAVERSQ